MDEDVNPVLSADIGNGRQIIVITNIIDLLKVTGFFTVTES